MIKVYQRLNSDILNFRKEVFILEQNIQESDEITGDDHEYSHLCLYLNKLLIGYLRFKISAKNLVIGRVAVKYAYRHKGYGSYLIEYVQQLAVKKGALTSSLESQYQVIKFYEKLGYQKYGSPFMDANIVHMKMRKDL